MNPLPPPTDPQDQTPGKPDAGGLISDRYTTRLMRHAVSLVDGPTERLADRLTVESAEWFATCYAGAHEAGVGLPFEALLAGRASIDQLRTAKSLGKRLFAQGGKDADAGLLLYFLAVALAEVHHGERLSSVDPAVLEESVALLAGSARGPEGLALAAWLDRPGA